MRTEGHPQIDANFLKIDDENDNMILPSGEMEDSDFDLERLDDGPIESLLDAKIQKEPNYNEEKSESNRGQHFVQLSKNIDSRGILANMMASSDFDAQAEDKMNHASNKLAKMKIENNSE